MSREAWQQVIQFGVAVAAELVASTAKWIACWVSGNPKRVLDWCRRALRRSCYLVLWVWSRQAVACIVIAWFVSGHSLSPRDSGETIPTSFGSAGLLPEHLARLPFPPHPGRSVPILTEGEMLAGDEAAREGDRSQLKEAFEEAVPTFPEHAQEVRAATLPTVATPEPMNAPIVSTAKARGHAPSVSSIATSPVTIELPADMLRIEVVAPQPTPAPSNIVYVTYDPNQVTLMQPVPVQVFPVLLTQPKRWWQLRK